MIIRTRGVIPSCQLRDRAPSRQQQPETDHAYLQLLDDAANAWVDVEQGSVMSLTALRRRYGRD